MVLAHPAAFFAAVACAGAGCLPTEWVHRPAPSHPALPLTSLPWRSQKGLELTRPDAPRAVDTEYYQRKIRGRGVGRKPHDVLVKLDQGAAQLQPAWDGGSRIDRRGLLVRDSRVLGVTDRR